MSGFKKIGISEALHTSLDDHVSGHIQNSVHDFLERAAGKQVNKTITLSADGTTASENVFQITGSVYLIRLYAIIRDVSTLTNCTAASFDLYPDAGSAVQITAATGVLSGKAVDTVITKANLAADAFIVLIQLLLQLLNQHMKVLKYSVHVLSHKKMILILFYDLHILLQIHQLMHKFKYMLNTEDLVKAICQKFNN